jgi:hypothetical protein
MLVGERRRKPDITQTRLARKSDFPCQLDAVIMTPGILDRMGLPISYQQGWEQRLWELEEAA